MSPKIISHFPRKDNRKMYEPDWESLPIVIIAIAGIIAAVLIYNNIHKIVTAEELPEVHAEPLYIVEEPSGGHETVEITPADEITEEISEIPVEEKNPILTDEEIIAMVVDIEAGVDADIIAKVAVASVVLNRCDAWGMTVESVIYQKDQFAIAKSYTADDLRAVEIAQEVRDLFPSNMLYFRNEHYHSFGVPYMEIGGNYFSLSESEETE